MAKEHFYSQAIWKGASNKISYPQLTTDIEVDVAIVGGGITGISTAMILSNTGMKVAVLEAFEVGTGTTGSSTGNLYAPIDERLFSISSKHDEDTMRSVAISRTVAVAQIEQWISEHHIDCDFHRVPWHLFTTEETNSEDDKVKKEYDAVKKAELPVTDTLPLEFPIKNISAITTIANQAQFNPLKYVQELANAIADDHCQIYEHTKVTNVEDGSPCIVHTANGKVRAKKVIMATHSPKGIYGVHTAMEPHREYAMAFKLRSNLPARGIYWHVKKSQQYSIRPYSNESGNFLLILGEPHKVGHKEHNEDSFKKIEEYARKHFDVESIEYTWAAQNYKPADNLPYIGTSPLEKNIFIATGFAADGLVYGTLSGMIISDTILGKENKWAKNYSPKRFKPVASATDFIKENVTTAASLIKDYLFYGNADELNEVKPGEGKTLKIDGERVAAYRDDNGKIHVVSAVCTHLGCIVHWNNGEKSWDCPCHGSRFSVDGEVLEGPAYQNLAKPHEKKEHG